MPNNPNLKIRVFEKKRGFKISHLPQAHPATQLVTLQISMPSPIPITFIIGIAVQFPKMFNSSQSANYRG